MIRHRRSYSDYREDYDRPSRRRRDIRDRESYFSEGVSSGVRAYFKGIIDELRGVTVMDTLDDYNIKLTKKIDVLQKALTFSIEGSEPLDPLVPLMVWCIAKPEQIPRMLNPSVGSYMSWDIYAETLSSVSVVENMFGSDPWEWFDNQVMRGYPNVRVKRMIQRERGKELSVSRLFQIDELITR